MTIATALYLSLLCTGVCAAVQAAPAPPLACNLKALTAAERTRHHELTQQLRAAIRNRSELPDGYAFKLDGETITLKEVGEWIGLERLCCPFLTFQLSASGNRTGWTLRLTGPEGVKDFLRAEFPSR